MTSRRDFIRHALLTGAGLAITPNLVRSSGWASELFVPAQADGPWEIIMPQILARIKSPTFPNNDFAVTKFGAKSGGATDCTNAFRDAIVACNKAGGGRVVVPQGVFLTGAIHLKSNVNLVVSRGATIKFSTDTKAYLPAVFTRWEGVELMNYSPFIYAFEQKNIAITGEGTLDGQSGPTQWWPWIARANYGWQAGMPSQGKDRADLFARAEQGVKVELRQFGEGHFLRPNFIQPYRCQNVLIDGVTVINSPMWEIHPVLSTNVTLRNVKIKSHGPNNDGCDPESCTDVLIENCEFDTGDDCIAIKSGRNADGRRLNAPTQNIIVRNCRMKDGHGGVTVGSEISGGVRYLFAEDCQLDSPNLDHAFRVKNNAMRGGLLEHLYVRRLDVGQVAHAVITIDFNYEEGAKGSFTPIVRDVSVSKVTSRKSKHALDIQGLTGAPISDLHLADCVFDNVAEPNIIKNLTNATVSNVKINGREVSALS